MRIGGQDEDKDKDEDKDIQINSVATIAGAIIIPRSPSDLPPNRRSFETRGQAGDHGIFAP